MAPLNKDTAYTAYMAYTARVYGTSAYSCLTSFNTQHPQQRILQLTEITDHLALRRRYGLIRPNISVLEEINFFRTENSNYTPP